MGVGIVNWTIRLALLLVAGAFAYRPRDTHRIKAQRWFRGFWSLALVLYLLHVAAAFHFYHGWSHLAALEHTAQETLQTVGIHWGGGLYVNYVFSLLWIADVLWCWASREGYWNRRQWIALTWFAFFAFIVINATIVFETGPTRWCALAIIASLAVAEVARLWQPKE